MVNFMPSIENKSRQTKTNIAFDGFKNANHSKELHCQIESNMEVSGQITVNNNGYFPVVKQQ